MKIIQFPLARITIGFVLGLIGVSYLKPNPEIVFSLLFISFFLLVIAYFVTKVKFRSSLFFGVATYLLSFCIGATTQIIHTDYFQKDHYSHYENIYEKPNLIQFTLREKLKSSVFYNRYIAIVNEINHTKSCGRILLNIRKDSLNSDFEIGTILKTNALLNKNKSANNPNQFDYSRYLENKQIYAQLYTDGDAFIISKKLEQNIWHYASRIRSTIIHNLEKSNFHNTELNVAIALILGQQQEISPDIVRDYQYAGAVHILSVSGLHIGFILLFVSFILKPIPNSKRGSFLKLIIILSSLSLFGIIAGLAPSVIRSVTMFSFVAIGNHLRRSVNIFHTLLVSILIILLFEPSFLFDVGFQLSYIALFFIIWLQPLLSSIWIPKNKILKYIWDILTVSFAAQIGTLPLSIYYFHQFPGLFFITNLVIIPVLSFIMIAGVVVMIYAGFSSVPLVLVKPFEWSIYYLDKIINAIASLEQFIIRNISFNYSLLIGSYLLIFTVVIWLKKPNFTKLILVLISIIGLQIAYFNTNWIVQNQHEWIVFNIKKASVITERSGNQVAVFTDKNNLKTVAKNNTINAYLIGNFSKIKSVESIRNTYFFKGKKILILDSLGIYPKNIQPDILLLSQSPKINLERMLQTVKPKIIIADASNHKGIQKNWKVTCAKQKIPFQATAEKGFYKID